MDSALFEAMETFSLDFSDDDKYLRSTELDPKKILNKIKTVPFRRGSGVKSPVTMQPTSRACDILTAQFGRGLEGMGQHYYFDSKNSQTHAWKFRTYKKDIGWLQCDFIFFPATLSIHELITGVQGSYYTELIYLQDYIFEFLK